TAHPPPEELLAVKAHAGELAPAGLHNLNDGHAHPPRRIQGAEVVKPDIRLDASQVQRLERLLEHVQHRPQSGAWLSEHRHAEVRRLPGADVVKRNGAPE